MKYIKMGCVQMPRKQAKHTMTHAEFVAAIKAIQQQRPTTTTFVDVSKPGTDFSGWAIDRDWSKE